jgi:conjugal transfer pilus assembly protein TraB
MESTNCTGSTNRISEMRQYKILGIGAGILAFIFLGLTFFSKDDRNINKSAHYKKEIAGGIDGLSEKELWIEKSTNELSDIKKQNQLLQEQLEKIQKVVIGIGRYMHAFDDQQEDKTDTIPSKDIYEEKQDSLSSDDNAGASSAASFDGLKDFVSGVKNETAVNNSVTQLNKPESKILKSNIRTIHYSTTESESNLDENFIFASTYARCVLVGSVTVSAGIGASSNPQPVLMRLTDMGNLPNRVRGFLKDAMVIGAAYGELSSESVVIRLERIVKIDKKRGIGIDIPVQGYVAGENGDSRIRGLVIDRAGAVVRGAAIGGFFSGMADYLTAGSRSGITFEPNSGLAQFSPQNGSKMLEQGASKGIGNAVEKYADFYIKRAEQLQPVIKIDGGRKLTIVFTQSVKALSVHMKKVRRSLHEKNRD